nr:unnamed protein product [Callosobruchus chinensis]
MVRYCYVCKIYSHQRESQGLSFHRLLNEPSRRAIWISLLGFEKTHPFPNMLRSVRNIFMKAILCIWLMEFRI